MVSAWWSISERIHDRLTVADDDELSVTRRHFADAGSRFGEEFAGRDKRHDGRQLFDERDRPVLQLAGREAFRMDITYFLKFQGALKRDRVERAATNEQGVARC